MSDFKALLYKQSVELYRDYVPHISIDTVIFGFDGKELYVLLTGIDFYQQWFLPGGYLKKEEDLQEAAKRVLFERTGAADIFLSPFAVFGDKERSQGAFTDFDDTLWHKQRFVTLGFYALVSYDNVKPVADELSDRCEWISIAQLATLHIAMDHADIIHQALRTLRNQLTTHPIGYNLLPTKFTLPELQRLYEAILGKELNRGNFYRKIKNLNILHKLDERRQGSPNRAPDLYEFDEENYIKALQDGLNGW